MADKQISDLTSASALTDGSLFVLEQAGAAMKANWGMMKNYISPGVAAQYSTSATYDVGDYVIYNGQLYRCTTAITTAETWTAAHWTAAVLGDDVGDLKADLFVLIDEVTPIDYKIIRNRGFDLNTGTFPIESGWDITDFIPVNGGDTLLIYNGQRETQYNGFYTSDHSYIGNFNLPIKEYNVVTVPANASYMVLSNQHEKFDFAIKNPAGISNKLDYLLGKNLCGDDSESFYPIKISEGDVLTLSTSTGEYESSDYNELQFYNDSFVKLGEYGLTSAQRTIVIDSSVASASYIKWSTTPNVPLQVEFGSAKTDYVEYIGNVFTLKTLNDNVDRIKKDAYGKNLCGDDTEEYYPISVSVGDVLTLSTSTGTFASTDYNELQFYDGNFTKLGEYGLTAATRTIIIDSVIAPAKYIKWATTPTVPLQVEFGAIKTSYEEYTGNIFMLKTLNENKDKDDVYLVGPVPIVAVMSYNVGEWYDGTRTDMPSDKYALYESIQKEILCKNYASIFCAQEYYYLMHTGAMNSKNLFLLPNYKHVSIADDARLTMGKAIGTNLPLVSTEMVDFVNQSGVAQQYQKSYIYINGHKVCVCNVHLSQISTEQVLLEVQELVSAVSNEEYFIVLGDFNVKFDSNDGASIITMFESINGVPCNCGDFGTFYTYRGSESLGTDNEALDNIFVSSNIAIKSVYMDTTKINADLPIQDHVPLIAYLEIF